MINGMPNRTQTTYSRINVASFGNSIDVYLFKTVNLSFDFIKDNIFRVFLLW